MGIISKVRNRYRYSAILLRQLVKSDFKLRYQGSVLGYIWYILRPLLLFLILYIVFTQFLPLGKDVPHYPVYLLLGIVLWTFFTDVTNFGVKAIVDKGALIRKINFPKYNIIAAVAIAAFISLGFNMVVVAVFMIFNGVGLSWQALWLIPLLAELFLVAVGMAFLLSALYVKFRDIAYIWEVVVQAGLYITPVIYPLQRIDSQLVRQLLLLNPLAQIIQDARYVLVTPSAITIGDTFNNPLLIGLVPLGLGLAVLVGGAVYFRSHAATFAEEV